MVQTCRFWAAFKLPFSFAKITHVERRLNAGLYHFLNYCFMPKINPDNISSQETYDRLRAFKKSKPFTTCYQCSRSQFNNLRELICRRPYCRARVISPSHPVAGCPDAMRHTITDALSNEALRDLGFSPLSNV